MAKAKKLVSAKMHLETAREYIPEIDDLLSESFDKDKIEAFITERFHADKAGEIRVVGIDEKYIELNWLLPAVSAEAEQLHKEALQEARQKKYSEAIGKWINAISLNADDPDYYFNAGIAFFEKKNYREATDNLEFTIQLCPIYYKARLILGTIYLKLRKFDQAETHLRESIIFQPGNNLALLNLATAYSVLKKYDEGIAVFNKIISLNENEVRAYFGLGKIYNIIGDVANANACFHKVVEIDQNGPLATHAKRAIQSDPKTKTLSKQNSNHHIDTTDIKIENLDELFSEAYSAYLYGDYEFSSKLYKKYLSSQKNDDHAWYSFGEACLRSGLIEQATNAFKKAISIKSSKGIYYKQLGICHDFQNEHKDALVAFKKALDTGKSDSMTITYYGKSLLENGKIEEAIEKLQEACKINKQNIMAEFHLAQAYLKQKNMDKATEHLHWVLNSKIKSPYKLKAKDLISEMQSA